ncbi:phosphoacetylglucosamine mutase isoform X2 [Typha angustifolia]|uniref:phosphoacetylglucosamine mutase isoform X2 n=1 Tax=Typha angustifolia TaxID=59011 RepID=UPI003C2F6307
MQIFCQGKNSCHDEIDRKTWKHVYTEVIHVFPSCQTLVKREAFLAISVLPQSFSMADEKQRVLLLDSGSRFPLPQGVRFSYGTAGFRCNGSILSSTVFRAGIIAALRSLKTGSVVGLMITASHNPVADNGVKIADPDGGMMTQSWEPFADALANAPDPQHLLQLVLQFAMDENIPLGGVHSAEVLLGRDTRPTGEFLLEAAKQGVNAMIGAIPIDMGILTTPQLHWMVRSRNKGIKATETDYFKQLSESFRCLMDLVPKETVKDRADTKVVVDGANGVGGAKLEELKEMLTGLEIHVRNSGKEGEGILNEGCGADYVQKEKVVPCGFCSDDVGTRCASLDGDADRLVYFRVLSASHNRIDLVDGDKILSLFAIFIKEQLSILNKKDNDLSKELPAKLGIVQTAYANGASTNYLKQLGLEVVFTPTGVKYLHKKASEYDIGIYFEANGHGTVLFSESFIYLLESRSNELASTSAGSERHKAVLRLLAVSQLINQAVGDALSGLLLVEAILQYMRWSFQKWSELYHDLPSRQLKVKVADRSTVITANAETRVVKPSGLQELIDMETAKYPRGRCFVRPSGTEDIIRVYAEGSTQEAADNLAKAVAQHVDRLLG